jgi:hypothetical protein
MIKPASALKPGTIMQLNPDPDICRNPMFCACLFIVTEPKTYGAKGYVQALGENGERGGLAFYPARWKEMEPTGGMAEWLRK